jgi:hypothetical protein
VRLFAELPDKGHNVGVPQPPETPNVRPVSLLRAELPRFLVLLGIGFMVIGLIATIALVASDSSCNAGTNLSGGGPIDMSGNAFCGHAHGFEAISFLLLVAGAGMLTIGGLILPTLRTRDARQAELEASQPQDQPLPD